jgi:dimethylglycine dehydrogenase
MGWMVRLDDPAKGDFIGRDAATTAKAAGPARRLVTFAMETGTGDDAADCIGNEPIWLGDPDDGGEVVGWVTSGGYAHHSQRSIALGYVPTEHAASDGPWEIEVVGVRRPATRLNEPPFDPTGTRMRS